MSSTSPIILILGSGPNVGQHVARAFASRGYRVALTSRNPSEKNGTEQLHIRSDLSNPDCVSDVFSKVKQSLGIPSVVVYNAAAATRNDAENPLSLSQADFIRDFNVNTASVFAAAKLAAIGFSELPDTASKTFIYTGNILNTTIIAPLLSLGVGKSATAHIIHSAAAAYSDRGFKFYYADERKPDGTPAYGDIDGQAHGEFYIHLAGQNSQGPWLQTFVKDIGYKSFPDQ